MSEVRWKMYIWHKTSAIPLSTYEKLLKLMEIWRSSDRSSLCSLFETQCISYYIIIYNYILLLYYNHVLLLLYYIVISLEKISLFS